jgi:cytoskeletal protein CcmA (bactofilin family)
MQDVSAQNMDLSGSLDVSQNTTIGGDLNVTGESTLSSLSVTGNETVSGTLSVTEATTLSSLSVTGNVVAGTIDSGNITGRTGTTITAPTITASGNLYVGQNTNNYSTKSIFFGGGQGDNSYEHAVIENRIYEATEQSELLLFKGNDAIGAPGPDRIRLRAATIAFDTYPADTTSRTSENIRMTILSNGNVGIGTTTPTALLDVNGTGRITGTTTLTGNVGIGGASGTETLLVSGSERITGNLDVSGDLNVNGNFNFNEIIQNITTVNNEVIISTQLDISNQGTGPALKVSQFGVGEDQDVAVFNAGDEGDAFKIDYAGNSHFYKPVEMSGNLDVSGNTTIGGNLDVSGDLTVTGNTELTGDVVVAGDLNVIGGSLDISGVTIKSYEEEEEERLFDTLVIRYPTLTGTGKFHGIREIQLWVNNVNVLPSLVTPSTFNVDGTPLANISNIPFFMNWSDKTLDPYHALYYPSNVANNIFEPQGAYWGIQNGKNVTNINISLYIPLTSSININQIQSVLIYNRIGNDMFVGTAVELYNRTNDPNLNQVLVSTNIITTNADVYRFDFGGIGTYNKAFVNEDSITNIVSNTYALTETTESNLTKLKIENAGLSVDGNLSVSGVDGNLSVSGLFGSSNIFQKLVKNASNPIYSYTVPVKGIYMISISVNIKNDDDFIFFDINNIVFHQLHKFATITTSNHYFQHTPTILREMNVNDVLTIRDQGGFHLTGTYEYSTIYLLSTT